MVGLIILFCVILGFYLLPRLFRWWLASRLRKIQQQMENGGQQGYYKQYTWGAGNTRRRERPAREGEVKIETGTAPGKKVNDRIGDYVNYEEVEVTEENREAN